MSRVHKALCLLLLLLCAQQGAIVHELSHFSGLHRVDLRVDSGGSAETACALCPAFAQAATPAFSHCLRIPVLLRAHATRIFAPAGLAVDEAIRTPRSRGPPSLS